MNEIGDIENPFDHLCIEEGDNDLLLTLEGDAYIDLISGFGAVLLGHSNRPILEGVKRQLDKMWITGKIDTPIVSTARQMLQRALPDNYSEPFLYTSGMEASEFAIRVATQATGKGGFVGFEKCMHGKSMATALLGWENRLADLPNFHRLPFILDHSEDEILTNLKRVLSNNPIAAVFLEPLIASAGGHECSHDFCSTVISLCRQYGSLSVFDEILTGFYRTGDVLYFEPTEHCPDILLLGKSLGNGFPVSAVAIGNEITLTSAMLPNSTYSDNPMTAAAVAATLAEMEKHNLKETVRDIANTITYSLSELQNHGFSLRGRGALWILEPPANISLSKLRDKVLSQKIAISTTDAFVRILPAATISQDNLIRACDVIRRTCLEMV